MSSPSTPLYLDEAASPRERAADLVGRMTLDEKIAQMMHEAPAIKRLGVAEYNWWNECLHGVARAGIATVFPQAIGLAATFNTALMRRIADVISTEARAKHHEAARHGDYDYYKGLTFWSPNINIYRDPRWGRGHETYGECPFLTGRMGVAFVKGLQGDDPKYLKIVATPKHYAAHSGPEKLRHGFNAAVSEKDMRETYLPHFKECVQEGGAWSVMGAYNRTNGEPCCGHSILLRKVLREEWGFKGYVVSDCGAIADIFKDHGSARGEAEAAAIGVKNGCDLECGCVYPALKDALREGLIQESEIDLCAIRLMEARIRLGMFDPPGKVPYASIPYEIVDCPEHRALSVEAARQSIVLLKNKGNLLPLSKSIKTLAVIGPNADNREVMYGNYHGMPSKTVTPLEGVRAKAAQAGIKVLYAMGCDILGKSEPWLGKTTRGFSEAIAAAERADAVILCMGLADEIEGEQGDAFNSEAAGDRTHLNLTGVQQALMEAIAQTGKPVVLVLINGGPLSINYAQENFPAILEAFYPGQEGGTAIADVIFGDYNPAGRLPTTYVTGLEQLPPFENYSMEGRTYRFLKQQPLYPFGFGLSYTTFEYSNLEIQKVDNGNVRVSAVVCNTGKRAGDEVVQLYLTDCAASSRTPLRSLRGFERIPLKPGESRRVDFYLTPRHLALIDDSGNCILEPGEFEVSIGGSQPCARSLALGAAKPVVGRFTINGPARKLPY